MLTNSHQSLVGVFSYPNDAQAAIDQLRQSGFSSQQISVIARDEVSATSPGTVDVSRNSAGNKAQEGTTIGAIAGGTVGGAIGLLVGLGTIAAVPGLGPVMLLGAAATALATTLGSGVLGATAGGLLGALVGYGIPEDQATVYRDRIHRGDYVVIVEGTETEMRQAEAILSHWNIQELRSYNAPTAASPRVEHSLEEPIVREHRSH